MVKMALNLLALEQEIKNLRNYMNQLRRDSRSGDAGPVTSHLQDRLDLMDAHLRAALTAWPQLSLDSPV